MAAMEAQKMFFKSFWDNKVIHFTRNVSRIFFLLQFPLIAMNSGYFWPFILQNEILISIRKVIAAHVLWIEIYFYHIRHIHPRRTE